MDSHPRRKSPLTHPHPVDRAGLANTAPNVTITLTLLIASAAIGFATGFVFRVWAIVPISLLIAIASAIRLHEHDFEFAQGVSTTVGCLVICQITYFAGSFALHLYGAADSTQEEVDGDPGHDGEQDVRGEDK